MAPCKPYQDAETLEYLYWEKGLSLTDIGDRFGVHYSTIAEWMERNDIPRRPPSQERPPHFCHADGDGYERIYTRVDGTLRSQAVHRLVAVSKYGIDAVKNRDVHHTNHIPWDNRPSNIEVLSKAAHTSLHRNE